VYQAASVESEWLYDALASPISGGASLAIPLGHVALSH
jgi:hypothetical protein